MNYFVFYNLARLLGGILHEHGGVSQGKYCIFAEVNERFLSCLDVLPLHLHVNNYRQYQVGCSLFLKEAFLPCQGTLVLPFADGAFATAHEGVLGCGNKLVRFERPPP